MTAIERGRSIQQRQSMLISTREPIDIRKKIRLMNLKNYIIKYTFNIKEIKHTHSLGSRSFLLFKLYDDDAV